MRDIETVRLDVERRMRRGERFSDVEDVVNASDLCDDEKAALWLLAWRFLHPRAQRREAIAHLERLSAATPPPAVDRRRICAPSAEYAATHLSRAGARSAQGARRQHETRRRPRLRAAAVVDP